MRTLHLQFNSLVPTPTWLAQDESNDDSRGSSTAVSPPCTVSALFVVGPCRPNQHSTLERRIHGKHPYEYPCWRKRLEIRGREVGDRFAWSDIRVGVVKRIAKVSWRSQGWDRTVRTPGECFFVRVQDINQPTDQSNGEQGKQEQSQKLWRGFQPSGKRQTDRVVVNTDQGSWPGRDEGMTHDSTRPLPQSS